MLKYINIYTSKKYKDRILLNLDMFGWNIQSEIEVKYLPSMNVIGPYDDKNDFDKPLIEVILYMDMDKEDSLRMFNLSMEYLTLEDQNLKNKKEKISGFIAGLFFSLAFLVGAIIFFVLAEETHTLLFFAVMCLVFSIPAIPLCIYGIIRKAKERKTGSSEIEEKLNELLNNSKIEIKR